MEQENRETAEGQEGRRAPLLLHIFHTFGVGGAQTRFVAIANHFGQAMRHRIVALNGDYTYMGELNAEIDAQIQPLSGGNCTIGALQGAVKTLRALRPDRLITHNWGTIEWAAANLFFGAPHIHIEDGFGPDELKAQKLRRIVARSLLLRRSEVVVPSKSLKKIAKSVWRLPANRVHYIPNGIDCERFSPSDHSRSERDQSNVVIGTVAALRQEKNVARLVQAVSLIGCDSWRLVIVGEGSERCHLEDLVRALGLAERVEFTGHRADPAPIYRTFDVFALTSDTEQMPYTILEAMASGCPVVATDVGDIKSMVATENVDFIVACCKTEVASALRRLIEDRNLRHLVGQANRDIACRFYEKSSMFQAFGELYGVAQTGSFKANSICRANP